VDINGFTYSLLTVKSISLDVAIPVSIHNTAARDVHSQIKLKSASIDSFRCSGFGCEFVA